MSKKLLELQTLNQIFIREGENPLFVTYSLGFNLRQLLRYSTGLAIFPANRTVKNDQNREVEAEENLLFFEIQ